MFYIFSIFILLSNLMNKIIIILLLFTQGCVFSNLNYLKNKNLNLKCLIKKNNKLKNTVKKFNISIQSILIDNKNILTHKNKIFVNTKKKQFLQKKITKINSYNKKKINLIWPLKKPVLFRHFNSRVDQLYEGTSLGAPAGTKVFAAASGKVLHIGNQNNCFGNIIILKHSNSLITIYANLSQIYVKIGMIIKKGKYIGKVGLSGGVQSPRVHFEVRYNRNPINPLIVLPKN